MVPRAPSFTSPQSPGDTKRQLWGKEITWRKVLIFNLHGFYSLPIQWNSTQSGIHSVYHLCTIFTRKNRAFFSWRHGGHIGVPNKSCGSWLFSYVKTFFVLINLHRCWPREWKRFIKRFIHFNLHYTVHGSTRIVNKAKQPFSNEARGIRIVSLAGVAKKAYISRQN